MSEEIEQKAIKTIPGLRRAAIGLIRMGMSRKEICATLINDDVIKSFEKDTAEDVIKDTCENFPNYNLIQKVMRSKLIINTEDKESKYRIMDPLTEKDIVVTKQNLTSLFNSKMDLSDKIYTCTLTYDPYNIFVLKSNEHNPWTYNTYKPAKWNAKYYHSKGRKVLEKIDKIPEMYERFLKHLFNNHDESYEYVLDWVANGLKSRNYCILATIGTQGVGKGVLGEIMRLLFGDSNFHKGEDRMFKGNFNSQIMEKRLVYCDELKINNVNEENKIKTIVNDFIEIEKKGIDVEEIRNYANFYISSNNMDAIKLSGDDRRFSIVNLTDEKLLNILGTDEIEALLLEENIEQLAAYLSYREIDRNKILRVFKSDRTQEVKDSTLNIWQEWFLDEYCPLHEGTQFCYKVAIEAIEENFSRGKYQFSRRALQAFSKRYPDRLRIKNTRSIKGKSKWEIEILKQEQSK